MLIKTSVHNPWDLPGLEAESTRKPLQDGANSRQVGGTHYKAHQYETWDVILDWGLGYLDGNAVKYLSRWRLKGGLQDLKKARHYLDKLIETVEADGSVSDMAVHDRGPK